MNRLFSPAPYTTYSVVSKPFPTIQKFIGIRILISFSESHTEFTTYAMFKPIVLLYSTIRVTKLQFSSVISQAFVVLLLQLCGLYSVITVTSCYKKGWSNNRPDTVVLCLFNPLR